MSKTYRTTGVVIKRRDWRENDSLFTIYTEHYGKQNLVAIGSKKVKSKLMGHLSAYGLVDIMVARGKGLDKLATARLIDNFKMDLEDNYFYIGYVYELLDKAIEQGERDEKIWKILQSAVEWLKVTKTKDEKRLVMIYFTLQLMGRLGYHPELFNCVICKSKASDPVFFSLANNGLGCSNCSQDSFVVSQDMIKLMRVLISDDLEGFDKLIVKKKVIIEVIGFFRKWVPYMVEKEINSVKYL